MKKLFSFLIFSCASFVLQAQEQFSVYFESNKYELSANETQRLSQWMDANKESKIVAINGYTDEDGTTGLNDTLAQRRVGYVFGLVKGKVKSREDFKTRSFGELHKHSPNKAENRKATIYYIESKDLARENEILGIKPEPRQAVKYPEKIMMKGAKGKDIEVVLDKELVQKVEASKAGDIIKLKNINFYENTFGIVPESRPRLFELLAIMQANQKLKIKILGHVCCMKSDQRGLSTQRAKAIMMFLNQNGIEKTRLSFEGRGTTQPIHPIPEVDETARAENRRVEIMVMEN